MTYESAIANICIPKSPPLVMIAPTNGFVDNFKNTSLLNLGSCSGYLNDSGRGNLSPSRSNSDNYLSEDFNYSVGSSIPNWTKQGGGTAVMSIVSSGSSDPGIGNVVQFSSGATKNSSCYIKRNVGAIPDTFGFYLLPKLNTVGTNGQDCQVVQIVTNTGKALYAILNDGSSGSGTGFKIFQDGTYQLLFEHGGNYYTEWWGIVTPIGGGNDRVDLYAGTEFVATRTGALTTDINHNRIFMGQNSGGNANRVSQMAGLNIGDTQLPDNMVAQWNAYTATAGGTAVQITVFDEDVCNSMIANTDITLSIKINGGAFTPVSFTDNGAIAKGIIDSTKDVNRLTASLATAISASDTITAKIQSFNGKFHAMQGFQLEVI